MIDEDGDESAVQLPSMEPLGQCTVFCYGVGHMLNDITSSCWFTCLLLFLTEIGLSPSNAAVVTLSGQGADAFAAFSSGELIDKFGHFKLACWGISFGCYIFSLLSLEVASSVKSLVPNQLLWRQMGCHSSSTHVYGELHYIESNKQSCSVKLPKCFYNGGKPQSLCNCFGYVQFIQKLIHLLVPNISIVGLLLSPFLLEPVSWSFFLLELESPDGSITIVADTIKGFHGLRGLRKCFTIKLQPCICSCVLQ